LPSRNRPQTRAEQRLRNPGVVSGRVFAITVSGDLKLARLAKVYLFLLSGGAKFDGDSVSLAWSHSELKAAGEMAKAEKDREDSYSRTGKDVDGSTDFDGDGAKSIVCRRELLLYDEAVGETEQWATGQKKTSQIVCADADEEGYFKMTAPVGTYTLIARGRAGFNEAFWKAGDWVNAEAGTETTIKLTSPEKSCLVMQ
jgi:hypothetical protein